MYTPVMEEGGYDPMDPAHTGGAEGGAVPEDSAGDYRRPPPPPPPEDIDRTNPFEPRGASTPYPDDDGEEHEMARMGAEHKGIGDTVPLVPKYEEFVDKPTLIERFKAFIKARHPKVDFSRIVIDLGKKKTNQGKAVALGPRGGETVVFTIDNTFTKAFSSQYGDALGPSAENIIAEDQMSMRDTQQRVTEAQQLENRLNKQATKQQQEAQERQRLENQLEQINQRIDNMQHEGGTEMERKMETDRLKRQSEKLKRDIKEAKAAEKGYAQTAKERDKAAREVARLQRKYEGQRQKMATTEEDLNRTKPLDELQKEAEELKRKIETDREIMNDKDATPQQRMAAGMRFSENTDELARLGPQVQEREEALPLRERVKNIFKKYGWTLQAVALAVGIVLSALALAGLKGLKAGTKAVGKGLKEVGQKLGSLLPGLIGSIASFIFKAAGQVFSFLAEHAWLLILAVVAFFMERLLKRRKSK